MTSESDRLATPPSAIDHTLRAVAAAIRTDPFVQLALLTYAVVTAPYVALGAETRASLMASTGPDLVFLALFLGALRLGLERVVDPAERRFWSELSVAAGCWLAASVLTFTESHQVVLLVGEEALYAGYYVAFVLALERRPHLRREERPQGALFGWPAFAIFVSGLFAHFVMIPLVVHRVDDHSSLPLPYLGAAWSKTPAHWPPRSRSADSWRPRGPNS